MNTTILSAIAMVLGLFPFAQDQNKTPDATVTHQTSVTPTSFSTSEIVTGYLKIKNALVKSDSKTAAQTAEALQRILNNTNGDQLKAAQKPQWARIVAAAKKQTKSIAGNSGKLEKQRLTFHQLSKNINELVTVFGASQKIYQDFCPMYEDGAVWLSETKEITNPYYGDSMLTCGVNRGRVDRSEKK